VTFSWRISMKKLLSLVLPLFLALQSSCGTREAAVEHGTDKAVTERAVIVDTDMGMDDARALLALTGSSGIRLAAVIATGGSASAAKGADNATGIIESTEKGYVPVIRGINPDLSAPPPWRAHAESLGGHPFPPPRRLTQRPLKEAALSAEGIPEGTWLVLGPLSSMSALEDIVPGTLGRAEVWMPATVEGGTVKGWNIGCDPASARRVLSGARRVYIVDTGAGLDEARILGSVEGDSPAAIWIGETAGAGNGAHAFLFDEIAAAAIASPEIFRISPERYALSGVDGETVSIERSGGGPISLVRLEDPAALEAFLHEAWELHPGGHEGHADHAGHHAVVSDPLARMKEFHGHLGPYVVLGYRMGMIALERTGSAGHFEISAEVHSTLRPPRSCLIDGVQLGSGCTLGKRNITVEETGGPPFAIFTTSGGTKVTVRLLPGVPALLQGSIDSVGVEATGLAAWKMDADSLFEVTTGH
jgi:formylmethanofuran dehydrogenase subunit E